MSWLDPLGLQGADAATLAALPLQSLAAHTPLFRAHDHATAFVLVVTGRIEVRLTAASGREILLYAVEPGQSCIQTTLGLLGDEPYSGTAITTQPTQLVLIPKPLFLRLMDENADFRGFVLRAFGRRMADLTHVLEQVAFGRIEVRLANLLLDMAQDGVVLATQADLAARIGSAREVISRKLESFARDGWITTERGQVTVLNPTALRQLATAAV